MVTFSIKVDPTNLWTGSEIDITKDVINDSFTLDVAVDKPDNATFTLVNKDGIYMDDTNASFFKIPKSKRGGSICL
jgi:hypothetical protein